MSWDLHPTVTKRHTPWPFSHYVIYEGSIIGDKKASSQWEAKFVAWLVALLRYIFRITKMKYSAEKNNSIRCSKLLVSMSK